MSSKSVKTIPVVRKHVQILCSPKAVGIIVNNSDGGCTISYLSWDEIAEIAEKRGRTVSKKATQKFVAAAPRALKSEIKVV